MIALKIISVVLVLSCLQSCCQAQFSSYQTICNLETLMYSYLSTVDKNTNSTVYNDLASYLTRYAVDNRNFLSNYYSTITALSWFSTSCTSLFSNSTYSSAFTSCFNPTSSSYTHCQFYRCLVQLTPYTSLEASYGECLATVSNHLQGFMPTVWGTTWSVQWWFRNKANSDQFTCSAFRRLSIYANYTTTCQNSQNYATTASTPTNSSFTYATACNFHRRMTTIRNCFPSTAQANVSVLFDDYYVRLGTALTDSYSNMSTTSYFGTLRRCTASVVTSLKTLTDSFTSATGVLNFCTYSTDVTTLLSTANAYTRTALTTFLTDVFRSTALKIPGIWNELSVANNETTYNLIDCWSCCCCQQALYRQTNSNAYSISCPYRTCNV